VNLLKLFCRQPIAYTRLREQKAWPGGVGFELAAQLTHVNPQVMAAIRTAAAPDGVQPLSVPVDERLARSIIKRALIRMALPESQAALANRSRACWRGTVIRGYGLERRLRTRGS
jgi:hypothetical protein